MKAFLFAAVAALTLGLAWPATAGGERDIRRDPGNYYDRGNWHVPRHNIRENSPRYPAPWIYPGAPRYYHGYDYHRRDYRGPYYRPGYGGPGYGPGYRGHPSHFPPHDYRGGGYLKGPGGFYLFNELLHDQHHYPRR